MLSTGNVMTEIQLDRSPSTLIVGQNGAGKSTILDALCFVLFNKPFRNIRKPQLINTINEKDMMVEIEFVIGRNKYLIRRGMKPNIFEIIKNGKLIDQPGNSRDYQKILEDTILRLNYKSFTQIVVLGNASFTPFMQLFAAERRAVIEDLLDIQVFTSMNLLLKDRISENKQKKSDINYQIDLNKDKIAVQEEYLKKIAKDRKKQIEDLKSESSDFVEKIGANEEQTKTLLENIDTIFESMPDKDSLKSKSERVSDLLFKLEDKLTKAGKKSKFFSENDNCPTCEQQIDIEVKADKVKQIDESIKVTEGGIEQLKKEQEVLMRELDVVNKAQEQISVKQNKVRELSTHTDFYKKSLEKVQDKIDSLEKESVSDNDASEKIKALESESKRLTTRMEELSKESELYGVASHLLKDGGIKTKIIRQYVPIMNKLVNKYLAALDFFVNFELDEEFNEVIKSRHRDEFSYSSFSEGEKMRIDLALLFTWRSIAKLKNSTNTNLLILDEVFDASLDSSGCDEFLKLLTEIGSDTNVFVISHKGDVLQDKFRNQITFEKVKNFSRIA